MVSVFKRLFISVRSLNDEVLPASIQFAHRLLLAQMLTDTKNNVGGVKTRKTPLHCCPLDHFDPTSYRTFNLEKNIQCLRTYRTTVLLVCRSLKVQNGGMWIAALLPEKFSSYPRPRQSLLSTHRRGRPFLLESLANSVNPVLNDSQ